MNAIPAVAKVSVRLATHRETSKRLSLLDAVSAHLDPFKQTLIEIPDSKGAHFKQTAERFGTVLERFLFVALVCRRKIDAIVELIHYAITTQNAVALAQGARSLVEHVAVQVAIADALHQLHEQLQGQTEGDRIHLALHRAETFFSRCYSGTSPKLEQEKSKQALHVNDCIKLLETKARGAADAYDFLCEFVHPNHGSNMLVSSSDLTLQVESIAIDMSRPEVHRMLEIVETTLNACERFDTHVHSTIAVLGMYVARFSSPKAKISNIYAVRKISPTGDGKTKETAFFFANARDVLEHHEQWKTYVERRRISLYSRQVVAVESNCAYDLYESSVGQLWHRIEYPE
jgi:hypothetical protein